MLSFMFVIVRGLFEWKQLCVQPLEIQSSRGESMGSKKHRNICAHVPIQDLAIFAMSCV